MKARLAEVCKRFGCTEEQARAQYRKTATMLREMADGCEAAASEGKKIYSGYPATAEQARKFRVKAAKFDAI